MQRLPALLLATLFPAALLLSFVDPPTTAAQQPPGKATAGQDKTGEQVDFRREIWPLLQAKCVSCHGAEQQEGQLRLDARTAAKEGGVSGRLVQPGKPASSLLIRRLKGEGDQDRMPLDEPPLTAVELQRVASWIEQGATWPAGVGVELEQRKPHWAYQGPTRPPLPAVRNETWPQNGIDYFVLAQLEHRAMVPSAPADPARLLRRVYLDLIGIPPTLAETDAFLRDPSRRAYADVVERLLASPRYGERWARPWLDLARYADSNGYQADQYRSVWPYRDWVINALNADMPFDRFSIEQLAGDLLPSPTLEQKVATGFHRLTTCNVEAGVDPEENRVEQIVDRVNTTGTVWLGSSIECAQCHNHKYDPFTQQEYYGLFAFFNNTPLEVEGNGVTYNFTGPKMPLRLTDQQQREADRLDQQIGELTVRLKTTVDAADPQFAAWEKLQREKSEQPETVAWHPLAIDEFESSGGASHELLADRSVLVHGERPDKDTYRIRVQATEQTLTGFKLETLTDDRLPGGGPGRHDPARPNFVLYEFQVETYDAEDRKVSDVKLHEAAADFSQARHAVSGAIDGDLKTAWAINPQFGKPHWATFLTTEPLVVPKGGSLVFTLPQHYGGCRTIGRLRLSARTGTHTGGSLPEAIAKIVKLEPKRRSAKQTEQLREHFLQQQPEITKLRKELSEVKKLRAAIGAPTTLVMIEMQKARETNLLRRGNFLDKGQPVQATVPASLHALDPALPRNRLGLAKWLVDPRNPLVGRVTVNRWWAEFFGSGLVETLEDFGSQSDSPSHPALLDWLAREFVDNGWSMKQLHRTVVLSATYQQSSRVRSDQLQRDPYNRWLGRGPRVRLSAEVIRDNALAACGLLQTPMGGPPIFPPQPPGIWRHVGRNAPKYDISQNTQRYRRGIYVVWRRSAPYASFVNFDAPDRSSCVVKRPRTNTPLQALTLLNDPAYFEMARAIAADLAKLPGTPETKVIHGFRRVLTRRPEAIEQKHLLDAFHQEHKRLQQAPRQVDQLLGPLPIDADQRTEAAAWLIIANILLNLDETITKG